MDRRCGIQVRHLDLSRPRQRNKDYTQVHERIVLVVEPERFKEQVMEWARKIRVEPKEIHIREMTRKWASCSTRGRLTFSTALLEESKKKRDSVIVHELLHLRYPNHGKLFALMLKSYLG